MDGKQFHLHETSTTEMLQLLLHEMLMAMLQLLGFPSNLTILSMLLVQTSPSKQHYHKSGKFRLFLNQFE
jgi:hypothetical protein